MTSRLGDIGTDASALAALLAASGQPGGISAYLTNQYAQLQRLPVDVQTMTGQVDRIGVVFQGAGANSALLDAARGNLATISANLPSVQYQVQRLMQAIGPVLPELQAGQFNTNVIATIAASGVDIVSTFSNINELLALRDDTRTKIQQAVVDPSLLPQTQQNAAQALASSVGTWTKYLLYGIGGWLIFKTLRKVL